MNICFICDGYPPAERVGGIEVFTQTLARGLVLRGNSVSVIGYTKGIETEVVEKDKGVYVVRLPPVRSGLFPASLLLRLRLEAAIRRLCTPA